MGILVEARGVRKSYRHGDLSTEVLRRVDMSVSAGEGVNRGTIRFGQVDTAVLFGGA